MTDKFFWLFSLFLLLGAPAHAGLKVFACEPEWAALVAELGGNTVEVYSATTAQQDPHHIEARPSLIARVRSADLVVCTGAELEAGWLPPLLRQAGNAKVQPGQPGYFEAAIQVERLEIPKTLDRAQGDIHASGNPHVHTDPRRVATVAEKLAVRLAEIDAPNAAHYREQHARFNQRWTEAMRRWAARATPLKGNRVVVHHKDWVYLFDWLGIVEAGTLEPKPGIPASAAHLAHLRQELARAPARLVVRAPYQDSRPSEWLARETGIRAVVLPYTVGGTERARDLFSLFDDTLDRLLKAAP
jgi:zinc/manganese transport system substrate-binding protein